MKTPRAAEALIRDLRAAGYDVDVKESAAHLLVNFEASTPTLSAVGYAKWRGGRFLAGHANMTWISPDSVRRAWGGASTIKYLREQYLHL